MRPGDRFDRFEIVAHIGEGGMGRVFRARDEKLGRDVAIKLLPSGDGSDEARQRMLREARAAAGVTHPHAVAIYDVSEHPEAGPFIVMEIVVGEPLRAKIGDASVTEAQKVIWLDQIAAALEAAHATHVVHRDVKPENVVVTKGGAAKVLDFGIAKRAATGVDPSAPTEVKAGGTLSTLTAAGVQVGTPIYMAPEQIKGDAVDARADQFAWGVVAYELLAGKLPWATDKGSLGLVGSILTDEPPALAGVGDGVATVVARAMSKRKEARFASMTELRAALGGAPAARGSAPPPSPRNAGEPSRSGARYDTETLKAIFEHAIRVEGARGRYREDDLVEAAREMGIDEATILDAAREVELARGLPSVDALRAEKRRKARSSFIQHLGAYLIVNTFLALMSGHLNKAVLLGWGVGLAFHLWGVVFPKDASDDDLLEEAFKRRLATQKKRGKPARERDVPGDVAAGAAELLATARRGGPRERVRVAAGELAPGDDERAAEDAAAEAEAARAERVKPKARR